MASTDGVGISGLTDAENDCMRLPHRGTSVPAHPPAPPLMPGGVNQYPPLYIPPDVQPTRQQQRGRSRNPQGTPTDIVMQPHQEPQLEDMTRSRSRGRSSQPVHIIDVQPHQEPQVERMLRSRSGRRNADPEGDATVKQPKRRFRTGVLQPPGPPPTGTNQQGLQPIYIPPEAPDQPGRTTQRPIKGVRKTIFKKGVLTPPGHPPPADAKE